MAPPRLMTRSGKLEDQGVTNIGDHAPLTMSPSGNLVSLSHPEGSVRNPTIRPSGRFDFRQAGRDLGDATLPLVEPIVKAGAMFNPEPWTTKKQWQDVWEGTKELGKGLTNDAHFLATGDYTTKPYQETGSGVGNMLLGAQELKPLQFNLDPGKPSVTSPLAKTGKEVYNTPGSAYPIIAGALAGNPTVQRSVMRAAKKIPGAVKNAPASLDKGLYNLTKGEGPGLRRLLEMTRAADHIQMPYRGKTGDSPTRWEAYSQSNLRHQSPTTKDILANEATKRDMVMDRHFGKGDIQQGGWVPKGKEWHQSLNQPVPYGGVFRTGYGGHAPSFTYPKARKGEKLTPKDKKYIKETETHELGHGWDEWTGRAKPYTPENILSTFGNEFRQNRRAQKKVIAPFFETVSDIWNNPDSYPRPNWMIPPWQD